MRTNRTCKHFHVHSIVWSSSESRMIPNRTEPNRTMRGTINGLGNNQQHFVFLWSRFAAGHFKLLPVALAHLVGRNCCLHNRRWKARGARISCSATIVMLLPAAKDMLLVSFSLRKKLRRLFCFCCRRKKRFIHTSKVGIYNRALQGVFCRMYVLVVKYKIVLVPKQ